MPILDSRQYSAMPGIPVYQTSEPIESGWGQPSISHYVFNMEGDLLVGDLVGGIYLQAKPIEEWIATESILSGELAAWDIISDEALHNLEAGLE